VAVIFLREVSALDGGGFQRRSRLMFRAAGNHHQAGDEGQWAGEFEVENSLHK